MVKKGRRWPKLSEWTGLTITRDCQRAYAFEAAAATVSTYRTHHPPYRTTVPKVEKLVWRGLTPARDCPKNSSEYWRLHPFCFHRWILGKRCCRHRCRGDWRIYWSHGIHSRSSLPRFESRTVGMTWPHLNDDNQFMFLISHGLHKCYTNLCLSIEICSEICSDMVYWCTLTRAGKWRSKPWRPCGAVLCRSEGVRWPWLPCWPCLRLRSPGTRQNCHENANFHKFYHCLMFVFWKS